MRGFLCFCFVYLLCINAGASAFGINLPFFNKLNSKDTPNNGEKLKLNNEDSNANAPFQTIEPETQTSSTPEQIANVPVELEDINNLPLKDDGAVNDENKETRGMRTGSFGGGQYGGGNRFRNPFRRNSFFGGGGYGMGPNRYGNGFGGPYPGRFGSSGAFGGNRYGNYGNGGRYPGQFGGPGGGQFGGPGGGQFGGPGGGFGMDRFGSGNFEGYPGGRYPGGPYQQPYPQSYFRDYNTESNNERQPEPVAAR